MVAPDPLHRSGRAALPHPAPALGHYAKTLQRVWVADSSQRKPSIDVALHAPPDQSVVLAPAAQNLPPQPPNRPAKGADGFAVHRHPIVPDVPKDHRTQIASNLRYGKMHASLKFTLDFLKLRLPPRAHRLPQHREPTPARLRTNMREAEKVEGLRLTLATLPSVCSRVAAELDQARLVRMQFQPKPGKPLPKLGHKPLGPRSRGLDLA